MTNDATQAMNPAPAAHSSQPFISADMRPELLPLLGTLAPLRPGANRSEIKAMALQALQMTEEEWLMENPEFLPQDVWEDVFARKSEVTWNTLDNEAVLLDLETSRYYTLNRIAAVIWDMLNGRMRLREILIALLERFDVNERVARHDLLSLVGRLRREKLIRQVA